MNRHNATLWIGTEKEQGSEEAETTKLFVDGAPYDQIIAALEGHPEIEEVYFAHGFSESLIERLENKVKITLEVPKIDVVPFDLRGRVTVVLRVPTDIDGFKTVDNGTVYYTDTYDESTEWDGRKVFPEDKVILE